MATSENVNSQLIGSVLSYMEDLKIASLRARLKIINQELNKELETAKRNSFNQQKSKETRMSDNVNTSKSDNQVKGYKVFLYGDPELKTITPKSGPNAGQEVPVLVANAYHRNFAQDEAGKLQSLDPTFMKLEVYGDKANYMKDLLKDGMKLVVNGYLAVDKFTGKDGKEKEARTLNADSVALDLAQSAIKSINFEKPQKEQTAQTEKKASEPEI